MHVKIHVYPFKRSVFAHNGFVCIDNYDACPAIM